MVVIIHKGEKKFTIYGDAPIALAECAVSLGADYFTVMLKEREEYEEKENV